MCLYFFDEANFIKIFLKPETKKSTKTLPKAKTKIVCWNIRRGLVKREVEIKNMLKSLNLSLLFLVETDTFSIKEEADYQMKNYYTYFQTKQHKDDKTRLICLAKIPQTNEHQIKHAFLPYH